MVDAPTDIADIRRNLDRAFTIADGLEAEYVKGRDYYLGTRAEVFASAAVRRLLKDTAEAAPISLAHIPVDVIADKVELASLTAKEATAAAALTAVADANDLDDEADDIILKACYYGDYYAIVDPIAEDNDGRIAPEDIKLVGSSPLTTTMVYDRMDQRTPLYGVKVWPDGKVWRARVFYDNCTVKLATPETSDTEPKAERFDFDYDLIAEEEPEDAFVEHPGGRMLLQHLAVGGKPYGVPVHRKAWGPQDAITKISATNLNNVDGQGFASRWALADPMAEIDDDIDDDFGDDGPTTATGTGDGLTKATTGESRVRSIPGAIAILRGIKQVGQFDATDSEDFLKNLDWYVRVMAVACGVPLFEFDLTGVQPSGESRRRAEARANKRAAKIQRTAGAFFRGLADTVLAVLGTTGTVTVTFNPTETATDKEGIELVASKIKTGVPITQALLEAGYTTEQVEAWYPGGQPHITHEYLETLASALQQLGQAKTLGVITDDELADMLPEILTGPRGEGVSLDDEELDDDLGELVPADDAAALKAKADALGILVRAGANPEEAATVAGLPGMTFPNVPTTVRIPEAEADDLEGSGVPAPAAPSEPA